MWHAVAHFVEAVRYKPKRRRFDSRWDDFNSSRPQYGPGVDLVSKRNEYLGDLLGARPPVRRVDILATFNCRL
jgi:hypothetical protein